MPDARSSSQRPTVPFHELVEIGMLDAPPGTGRVAIPDKRKLQNHLGTVHGGMLYAVGEIAAAAGMMGVLGDDFARLRAITRSGSISYLKPARGAISGESLVAMTHADILEALAEAPSTVVPVQVKLTDAAGTVVAELEIEFHLARPRE